MLDECGGGPIVGSRRQRREPRQRRIEVAGRLVHELDRWRHVGALDVDVHERAVVDPGLVFDLDGVVADADDQIGGAQEFALELAAGALDAAERERVLLIDHALGHGGGGEWQMMAFDEALQQRRIAQPHGGGADDRNRPLGAGDQRGRAGDGGVRRGRKRGRRRQGRHRLVGGSERHVLGEVEMHRPFRLA